MAQAQGGKKQKVVAEFRRSEILTAAAKVFASKGFQPARMEEIAKAAHLAKGTLYLYFRSKDAIYEATVRQALAKLAALTEEHVGQATDFAGRLAAFISVRIDFWHQERQLYRIILGIRHDGKHRRRSMAWRGEAALVLQSIFEDAAAKGEIPRQDFEAAAWTTMDAIRGVNERRLFSDEHSTGDDARFLTAFLLGALSAGAGRG